MEPLMRIVAEFVCAFLVVLVALVLLVRFCKRLMAEFHRAFTNKILCRFAARLPGFGIVVNTGRKSGRLYLTPVNLFWRRDEVLIALTYGRESGWVANVLAAGRCELQTRCGVYRLCSPVVVHDPSRRRFPRLVRAILGLIDANDYLQFQIQRE